MTVKIDIRIMPDCRFTNRVAVTRRTITNGRYSLEIMNPKGEWECVPEGAFFDDDSYHTIEYHTPKPKLYMISDGYYVPEGDGHVFTKAVETK